MGDGEPAKILLPYLRRANEVQKYEPLVAYYCRLYAKNRVLKIPSMKHTKATQAMLSTLMQQLSEDTKSIQLSSNDSLYVEDLTMSMFMKADKQERSGKADMRTAKTFYVASLFFEILHYFGDVRFDVEQKQIYAAWRAAEIYKALKGKANRSLKAGSWHSSGLATRDNASEASIGGLTDSMLKSDKPVSDPLKLRRPSYESSALRPKVVVEEEQLPSSSGIPVVGLNLGSTSTMRSNLDNGDDTDDEQSFYDCSEAELSALSSSDSEHEMDHTNSVTQVADESDSPFTVETSELANESSWPLVAEISKAHKAARLAVSALAFDDVPSAVSYLEQALDLLTTNPSKGQ